MAKSKPKTTHAEVVLRFADKLKELRLSRGMTQAELANKARVTISYIGRLESAGAAPGIDLVQRLADALGIGLNDLLPADAAVEPFDFLRDRARSLFDALLASADQDTLKMLCPLLARLGESPTRRR